MSTNPSHFSELCEHNYYRRIVFPKHPPIIFHGLSQWPLSRNICPLLPREFRKRLKYQDVTVSPPYRC